MTDAFCLFCDVQTNDRKRIVAENDLAYAIRDSSDQEISGSIHSDDRGEYHEECTAANPGAHRV